MRPSRQSGGRLLSRGLLVLLVGAVAILAYFAFFPRTVPAIASLNSNIGHRTVAQLMALSDAELEKADIVEMNIAVAKEIPGLEKLEYEHYRQIVDAWTEQFIRWLPTVEYGFQENPAKYKNDAHFFHLGMLAQFLGQNVGIAYIEEQKQAQIADRKAGRRTEILYTDPGQLLLHGLIDTKRGTCGTMPTLHVAIARRLGWPVALACANSHFVSRYDDGKVVYNIEMTYTEGGFSEGSDRLYMQNEGVTRKAIACGSDLRKLSAREMLALAIAARARHYNDIGKLDLAARDYALAFTQMPNNRKVYIGLVANLVETGEQLFNGEEIGHPAYFGAFLAARYAPRERGPIVSESPVHHPDPFAETERTNAMNRANMERLMPPAVPPPQQPYRPPVPGVPQPSQPYQPR